MGITDFRETLMYGQFAEEIRKQEKEKEFYKHFKENYICLQKRKCSWFSTDSVFLIFLII